MLNIKDLFIGQRLYIDEEQLNTADVWERMDILSHIGRIETFYGLKIEKIDAERDEIVCVGAINLDSGLPDLNLKLQEVKNVFVINSSHLKYLK